MRHTNKFVIAMLASVMVSLLALTGIAQETINWATQADTLRGRNGQQFTFVCPAGGPISSRLWGTNVYTDDGVNTRNYGPSKGSFMFVQ